MNRLIPLTLAALCVTAPASAQITSFQHIILVVQENRTPDNLFYGLCTTPSACSTQPAPKQYNIQTTGWLDNTSPIGTTNPHPVPLGVGYDIGHGYPAFVAMCDLKNGACAMDGAAHEGCLKQPCPPKSAFGYVDNSTGAVQPCLDLVRAYGWANYMFQTNQGSSRRINSCLARHRLRRRLTTTTAFSQQMPYSLTDSLLDVPRRVQLQCL